jgi:hypothetical protein
MKSIISLFLLCLLLGGSGCMTAKTIQNAQGEAVSHKDKRGADVEEHPNSKPGYYCLIPLTIPLDIVTSPIQLIVYLQLRSWGSGWN